MNHSQKSTPMIPERGRKQCPVCGKPSYSLGGVHPQCAMRQADAPRKARLQAEKKRLATLKSGLPPMSWMRACPNCSAQVHVRRKICECGYVLGVPS